MKVFPPANQEDTGADAPAETGGAADDGASDSSSGTESEPEEEEPAPEGRGGGAAAAAPEPLEIGARRKDRAG